MTTKVRQIAIDIETSGLSPFKDLIWFCTVNWGKTIEIYHKPTKELKQVLEDPSVVKVIHNAIFDCTFLAWQWNINVVNIWDSRLAEIVIQGVQIPRSSTNEQLKIMHSSSLKYTLARYGLATLDKSIVMSFVGRNPKDPWTNDQLNYAKDDVRYLLALKVLQEFLLNRDGGMEVALLENKVVEKSYRMRILGVGVDRKGWHKLAMENERQRMYYETKLPKTVKNWNSPKQVKEYFNSRGIMIESLSDIDENYTSNDKVMQAFMAHRDLHKSVTSYGREWLKKVSEFDDRVHCDVEQIVNTGRFALNDPNLQQLPGKGRHREFLVAKKGHKFVIGDFGGQELGIMAAAANEKVWIKPLLRGEDLHSITASMLYGSVWAKGASKGCEFPKKCKCKGHVPLRFNAKVLNFMLAYGGGPQKFALKTGVSFSDAKKIVNKYKLLVPKLTSWLWKNGKDAAKERVSYSADPYKRKRILIEQEEYRLVNQGKNNPVQAAGANMIKLAMISLPLDIVLVVHDEIVCEVPNAQVAQAVVTMRKVMEASADYVTGIKGIIKAEPRVATNLMKV